MSTKLTDKQSRFCDEYLVDLNATQAAIRAGYSKKTAAVQGFENLRKPNIRKKIDEHLQGLCLSKGETLKALSDIAKSSLNDYFTVKEVAHTPQIVKPLREIIRDLFAEIEDEGKFAERANLVGDDLQAHLSAQEYRRREILRLQIRLERNPHATSIVDGKPRLISVVELDMPRLVQDKEAGRIKSVKNTEHGLNIELYPADAALRDLARVHGLYEKDNEQAAPKPQFFKIGDQLIEM